MHSLGVYVWLFCKGDTDCREINPLQESEHPLWSNFGVILRPHLHQQPQLSLEDLNGQLHKQFRTTDFGPLFTGIIIRHHVLFQFVFYSSIKLICVLWMMWMNDWNVGGERESRTCKVCMDSEVNTVFLPCGHLVCCDTCSPALRNCAVCRALICGTVKDKPYSLLSIRETFWVRNS